MSLHLHFDGAQVAVAHTQDVAPILERNAMLRGEEQHSDWGRHVASIPNVVLCKWLNDEHAKGNTALRMFTEEFDRLVQKQLQDPEWAYLRVDKPSLQVGWSW